MPVSSTPAVDSPVDSAARSVEPPAADHDVTVTEYGLRRSTDTGRIELLNAFCREEIAAGRVKDSESAFDERYAAFASRPAS